MPNGPGDLRPSGFSFPIELRPNSLRRLASGTDGKHARHGREVADVTIDDTEQRGDGGLVGGSRTQIAHWVAIFSQMEIGCSMIWMMVWSALEAIVLQNSNFADDQNSAGRGRDFRVQDARDHTVSRKIHRRLR